MAGPSTPNRPGEPHRPGPLRVRLVADERIRRRAAWALEALLARASVADWLLLDGEHAGDADLGWGATGTTCTLPHDPGAWDFAGGAGPDFDRDPLAATFWWLARVEEQLAPEAAFDEHGRFRFAASRLATLDDPLAAPVDEYAMRLAPALAGHRLEARRPDVPWRIVATHDVDLPWRWTPAGRRRALRSVRDGLRSRQVASAVRTASELAAIPILRLRRADPWSNAGRITRFEAERGARSTHFLLAGRHAPEDGDAVLHERGRRYVRELVAADPHGDAAGLHGSYTSSKVEGRLASERAELERRIARPVRDHRFHYLRHRPVEDWPRLEGAGLATDCSLGYAEQPGFRAGTTHPFRAWDHGRDRPLELVVVPLALMDATFDERYLGLGAGWAAQRLAEQVVDRVRELGGSASVLVHNDRLCTRAQRRWTELYGSLLDRVRAGGGRACTAAEAAAAYRELLPSGRPAPGPAGRETL